jgi:enoyl-[acyl-carrier protein] reductase I
LNETFKELQTMNQLLMTGKKGLIMGVANNRSIAWAISQQLHAHGAQLAFTFQGEALQKRVTPLAESINSKIILPCDVTVDSDIESVFQTLEKEWGQIDFVLHAIGYSDREELKGKYVNTSRKNFLNSMDISCYSFTAICQHAARLMPQGGSLLTMSYYGAEKVMPHYNVMGVAKAALESSVRYLAMDLGKQNIRVNGMSAGPIKTLAASGIGDFHYILKWNQYNAPLRRNVTLEEVGKSGLYLLSDLSSGVTGEIHHVDCGYHVVGMKAADAPDISVQEKNQE